MGLDGKPINDGSKDVTLRTVATQALMASFQGEDVDGEEKFKRYQLAVRINAEDSLTISPEQAAKLKLLIGKGFTPAVVGPCFELLNR